VASPAFAAASFALSAASAADFLAASAAWVDSLPQPANVVATAIDISAISKRDFISFSWIDDAAGDASLNHAIEYERYRQPSIIAQ
jgi:hypothetical protein